MTTQQLSIADGPTPGLIVRVVSHTWPAGCDFVVTEIRGSKLIGLSGDVIDAIENLTSDALRQADDSGEVPESALNPHGGAWGWISDGFGGLITSATIRSDRKAWVSQICEHAVYADEPDYDEWAEGFGISEEEWIAAGGTRRVATAD